MVNIGTYKGTGLSLRARDRRFPPVTISVNTPGYFHVLALQLEILVKLLRRKFTSCRESMYCINRTITLHVARK